MKIKCLIIIAVCLFLNISCNTQSDGSVAAFKLSSNSSIQIRRVQIHAFLAEYDRYLSLVVNGKTITEIQIATDTGGYSRANIYAAAPQNVLIVEDLQGLYEINLMKRQINKLDSYPCKIPKEYIFIGAFDTDESKQWQFIPASKSKQMKIATGCVRET